MKTAASPRGLTDLLSRYGLLTLAVLLVAVFSVTLPATFPTALTARSILDNQSIVILLALAEMLVVIVGEFDLSVGYLTGLGHILVIGLIVRSGLPWELAVVLVLLIGGVVGLLNGVLVHVFRIDSFIATLGTGTLAYAVSNWYTQGQQVAGPLTDGFKSVYASAVAGVPVSALYVVGLAFVLWLVLEYTAVGRFLYALGANRRAAELTGIPSRRYVIGAFAASGVIVAAAGVLLASRLQIGTVSTGPDFLLPVFVGALLGSTTVKPGRANAWGTVIAVLLLGIGIAGLQQLGGDYFIVPLFNGSTLIIGVGLAGYAARRVQRTRNALRPTPTAESEREPQPTA